MSAKKRGLGRGLDVLLSSVANTVDEEAGDQLRDLSVDVLQPGRHQPRRQFDPAALDALTESVRAQGIVQPIVVRAVGGDRYEIVAGERRWRAAQRAQLHEVPVIIRDLADREALELALVENLQRENLSALEEAEGYRRLLEEFKNTQEDLAQHVGKSRSHIANMLRLLGLPSQVKALLDEGQLTAGHARVLVTATDPVGLAKQIVAQGLNVRQAERMASAAKPTAVRKSAKSKPGATVRDADTLALERDLSNLLGLKVAINFDGQGSGALTVHYKSLDQLDDLLQRLTRAAGAAAKPTED